MSKHLHDVTIPILYKSIKVSASEIDLWNLNIKPFLGTSKRHLKFVKHLRIEANFHLNIKKRCPHHAQLADYLGEGDDEDDEDDEVDEVDEDDEDDEDQSIQIVYGPEDTLNLLKCLSEDKLRSFR